MIPKLKTMRRSLHRLGMAAHRATLSPFRRKGRLLFVLGTMRSGSTLISHILTNNAEICGFGESHLVYDRPAKLLDLRYWVMRYTHRYPPFDAYLLDKVLHNEYTPDLGMVLRASDPKLVFLLRMPAPTERSLRKMIAKLHEDQLDKADTWEMLRLRYVALKELLEEVPADVPVALLSYEGLLSRPEDTLAHLSQFLQLKTPLSTRYTLPRWGKTWGIGDGSAKAQSGVLEAAETPLERDGTPPEVLDAFDSLRAALEARSGTTIL